MAPKMKLSTSSMLADRFIDEANPEVNGLAVAFVGFVCVVGLFGEIENA